MKSEHSLTTIRGVGDKTEKLFGKLGIRSTDDLVHYYPRDYDIYEAPVRISQLIPGKKWAVTGILQQTPDVKKMGPRAVITTKIREGDASLSLTWFNMPLSLIHI